MISYKEKIAEILAPHVDGLEKDEILDMLETPADSKMGGYAFPCFKLAKIFLQGTTDDRTDFGRGDRSGVCF